MVPGVHSRWGAMFSVLGAYIVAVLIAYAIGSTLATQVTLGELRAMGMSLTLTDHYRAVAHDFRALAGSYLPLIAAVLAPALIVATRLSRPWPKLRPFIFPLLGALAVVAPHYAGRWFLGYDYLFAVREWYGMLFQAMAGWFGAYYYLIIRGLARR